MNRVRLEPCGRCRQLAWDRACAADDLIEARQPAGDLYERAQRFVLLARTHDDGHHDQAMAVVRDRMARGREVTP
jgi:hypothetical protein